MTVQRSDVVIVDFPFSSGSGGKARPAVIVQNDRDNSRLNSTIIAMITSRTHRSAEPTQVLIDVGTPDGKQTGLHKTSVVNCVNLFTIDQTRILKTIGRLSPRLSQEVDDALKAALALP
jgi:mRNA interferase MazF